MAASDRHQDAPGVSLVIPGRSCARTIAPCLGAAVAIKRAESSSLNEIIFVDDGSTDDTAEIVSRYPVVRLQCGGKGPGAARNTGWRAASSELVWFVDADCVAEPDALSRLLPHLGDLRVAGVGGSYGNVEPGSVLACLIHEEIVERHMAMPSRVNFLASFNVLYRRSVLESLGGFGEHLLKGQDAELSWRVLEAGHQLAFDITSRVKHYHPTSWRSYLGTQLQQGYWRVWLCRAHPSRAVGSSYSGWLDHVQPPLAVALLLVLPLALLPHGWLAPAACALLLAVAQVPMTARVVHRTRSPRYLMLGAMGFARAFWRGLGMIAGILAAVRGMQSSPRPR